MQKRHKDHDLYFEELARSCTEYFIPYIEQFTSVSNKNVLEIGCGRGGNLYPFYERSCNIYGLDIDQTVVAFAKSKFESMEKRENQFEFSAESIFASDLNRQFDIIIIHDVIEHIEEKDDFFKKIKTLLTDDGIVYFGFPAWQMPFGGHQQLCESRICSKLPFIHLLPNSLYVGLLKAFGESRHAIDELLEIKRCRVSVERFEKLIQKHRYTKIDRTLWLINPHYKIKFNLTPVKLNGFFSSIAYLRNFYTSSCFYVLKK